VRAPWQGEGVAGPLYEAMSLALVDLGTDPVPDYVEPVEAWRVWRVVMRDHRVVLQSLFAGAIWEPATPLVASCTAGHRSRWAPWRKRANDHAAPDLDCRCGVYGVRSVAAARSYLETPPLLCRDDRVIGRVALWGDVVEGPSGWRASHAYPVELYVPSPVVAVSGLRRRAYVDEILLALEAYRVPVDVVAPSALSVR
jgi:hypothetical protein